MAGVKGKSGRRSNANEYLRLRVLDKAWVLMERDLDDPDLDPIEKRELYKALCTRNVPQHVQGNFKHEVTEMPAIQKEYSGEANNTNRIAEYFIGSSPPPTDT